MTDYVDEANEMLGKGYNLDPVKTKFVSTISGFTPAPDILCKEYGFVTALVWGRVWRYCQMRDGVCRASVEKLADGLGMSGRTIIRHLESLCGGGYLLDTTPDLRNKPHIYADTGKIKIRFSGEVTMTESHSAMTESHTRYDSKSVEESKKKEEKKEKEERFNAVREKLETLTGGGLNSDAPRLIDTWLEKHENEWIFAAIDLAKNKGARHPNYVDEVLITWEAKGYPKSREERVNEKKSKSTQTATKQLTEEQVKELQSSVDWTKI